MSMKRYLIAFGAAGLVFAGVYGSAAALAVDGGAVQAGQDTTLQCDPDGVFAESYLIDAEPPAVSSGVRIGGVNGACIGEELFATVSDAAGVQLARGSAAITGATVTVRWATPVQVADIEQLDLSID